MNILYNMDYFESEASRNIYNMYPAYQGQIDANFDDEGYYQDHDIEGMGFSAGKRPIRARRPRSGSKRRMIGGKGALRKPRYKSAVKTPVRFALGEEEYIGTSQDPGYPTPAPERRHRPLSKRETRKQSEKILSQAQYQKAVARVLAREDKKRGVIYKEPKYIRSEADYTPEKAHKEALKLNKQVAKDEEIAIGKMTKAELIKIIKKILTKDEKRLKKSQLQKVLKLVTTKD